MADLDEPRFEISRVAEVGGFLPQTLRNHLQKGHWRLDKRDAAAEGPGKSHLLTLRRALQIAAAGELIRNGVEAPRAFSSAYSFSDLSHDERDPGELYPGNGVWTALFSYPGDSFGTVVRFTSKETLLETMFLPSGADGIRLGRQISGTGIWLNYIDFKVRAALVPGRHEYDPIVGRGA